jgi:3-oxoacyl-[acyl-carrier-protein] synthase II
MTDAGRETWITGAGIVSGLGEGRDAHWGALDSGRIAPAAEAFAPYLVHPLAGVNFDTQIPKKGDQRQMEPWQRIGTYAAGLALDDAGIKGNVDLLGRMDLVVAAGGGERDVSVDSALLSALPGAADPAAFLNERLMNDLRPTLFLAQLSNLLAGNISIVHGVAGSSRTFLGEENAGVDAVRIARARIAAGQSEIALVGGAFNAERKDSVMLMNAGGFMWKGAPSSVWSRAPGGMGLGSMGAFVVLEAREHAQGRGADPLARLTYVASDQAGSAPGAAAEALQRLLAEAAGRFTPGLCAVISGATGAEPVTAAERAVLSSAHPDLPVRATGTYLGHGFEPQFVLNLVLAAASVKRGKLFAGNDESGFEQTFAGPLRQALVTSVGHWRGQGLGLVEAVD